MQEVCPTCGGPLVGGFCDACGDLFVWPKDEASDPLVGMLIDGRYDIVELLSLGGMARLYKGLQRSLDREVAIKILPPHLMAGGDADDASELVSRFFIEAQTASSLNHPNIISVFDFGRMRETGLLYIVMELLDGVDVWTLLHGGDPPSLTRSAGILIQTLEGLNEAHSCGITHRDVKPENIIVVARHDGMDLVKVIDFGVAKLGSGQTVTRSGRVVGSPQYMSPEQARGDTVGPSADLYSVGVVMFELLTGIVPFDARQPLDIMKMHIEAPVPDPRTVTSSRIPDEVAEICLRALAKTPEERFSDAGEFARRLWEAVEPPAPAASRASLPPHDDYLPPEDFQTPSGGLSWSAQGAGRASAQPTLEQKLPMDVATPASAPPRTGLVGSANVPPRRLSSHQTSGAIDLGRKSMCGESTLYGRAKHLQRAAEVIRNRDDAVVLHFAGCEGSGRSRLAREARAAAETEGASAYIVDAPDGPHSEVGFSGLAKLISALSGAPLPKLRDGSANKQLRESLMLVGGGAPPDSASWQAMKRSATRALEWAIEQRTIEGGVGPVMVLLDSFERFDPASKQVIESFIADRTTGIRWVICGSDTPDLSGGLVDRIPLTPLRVTEGRALLEEWAERGVTTVLSEGLSFWPLTVRLLSRWPQREGQEVKSLEEMVNRKIRWLGEALRRSLEGVSVLGGGPIDQIGDLLHRPEDLDAALWPLGEQDLIEILDGPIRVSHNMFSRIAQELTPQRTMRELQTRAAALHRELGSPIEIIAYHGIRGEADFGTFFTVEEAAERRIRREDLGGAIELYSQGMRAARELAASGDVETASSARSVFGRKLATVLSRSGRQREARRVLEELLSHAQNDGVDPDALHSQIAQLGSSAPPSS